MVDQSDIDVVETTEDHYRFQFRGRERFAELTETPEWAQDAAETISENATVRMGRLPDSESVQVASVEIRRKPNVGREEAKNIAEKIVEAIHA